jgi:uncharacterized membrane protein YhaH (DUF805 family)
VAYTYHGWWCELHELRHTKPPDSTRTFRSLHRPLTPQITYEALFALALFLPSIALATAPLEDVTYRGEMGKR